MKVFKLPRVDLTIPSKVARVSVDREDGAKQ